MTHFGQTVHLIMDCIGSATFTDTSDEVHQDRILGSFKDLKGLELPKQGVLAGVERDHR